MGKYFRTIYLYVVTFATLCMVIAGFVGMVNSIIAYAYPVIDEYEVSDIYDYGTTDEATYLEKVSELEKIEKRTSIKEIFTYGAVLTSGLPLYFFHSNQIKKESEKEV